MNDWFGDVVTAARAPSYVCCPLEPVVGDTIFLVGERPEMADATRRRTAGLAQRERPQGVGSSSWSP